MKHTGFPFWFCSIIFSGCGKVSNATVGRATRLTRVWRTTQRWCTVVRPWLPSPHRQGKSYRWGLYKLYKKGPKYSWGRGEKCNDGLTFRCMHYSFFEKLVSKFIAHTKVELVWSCLVAVSLDVLCIFYGFSSLSPLFRFFKVPVKKARKKNLKGPLSQSKILVTWVLLY